MILKAAIVCPNCSKEIHCDISNINSNLIYIIVKGEKPYGANINCKKCSNYFNISSLPINKEKIN